MVWATGGAVLDRRRWRESSASAGLSEAERSTARGLPGAGRTRGQSPRHLRLCAQQPVPCLWAWRKPASAACLNVPPARGWAARRFHISSDACIRSSYKRQSTPSPEWSNSSPAPLLAEWKSSPFAAGRFEVGLPTRHNNEEHLGPTRRYGRAVSADFATRTPTRPAATTGDAECARRARRWHTHRTEHPRTGRQDIAGNPPITSESPCRFLRFIRARIGCGTRAT